jgi:hypothetical protein
MEHIPMSLRTTLLGLATAGTAALAAGSASAAELEVPMDEVRMMTFRAPIRTVVVGNPLIADVSVVDDRHIVILGKNIGNTNVVVLNNEGTQVANEMIIVIGHLSSRVTLNKGAAQITYACGGDRCNQVNMPGDSEAAPTPGQPPYLGLAEQIDTREVAGRAAAGAPAEAQAQTGGPPQ